MRDQRPLSPHATIYRPPVAMMTSIMHRFSAIAMYLAGGPLLVWWLLSLADGPGAYEQFTSFTKSWIGTYILFGLSWCFFQHLASGFRHLVMDVGAGYEHKIARNGALATFAASTLLTLGFWTLLVLM
ncbi:succinate dehydrogenase, cytochrome b556 subunit [Roseixanthobacter glucoisosaccharinicivorans]|uniref:succinate dehydrogenase, cytochrome b556 subunit n=1 Tax=Roseixanthobacter glucoisosaccharinicivorans TaxID=3119923 RepID=UPI003726DD2E